MFVVLCSLLLVLAAIGSTSRAAEPLIVAHRGASKDAPENTLAAFRLAWEQGADAIEGDFWLTTDGRVVCVHDADMKRLADSPLVVRESTFAELRALDVGRRMGDEWRGEKVPSLEEVLAVVPAGKKLLIELKTGPEIVEPLAAVIESSAIRTDQLLIMGFDAEAVAAAKRRLPKVKCHWLTAYKQQDDGTWRPTSDEVIATIRRVGADGLGSDAKPNVFDAAYVERLRAGGVAEFHVWTVDDKRVGEFYRDLGAWGLTTNRPGALRAEMSR